MGNFSYQTIGDFHKDIKKLNLDITSNDNTTVLFQSLKLPTRSKELSIHNRIAIHPMEGFDATEMGNPTQLTQDRYKRFGKSGAGVVWFEATSVVPEGRSNPHQLMITEQNIAKFKGLITSFDEGRSQLFDQDDNVSNLHFRSPLKILQLTHSGRYSKPGNERIPLRAMVNSKLDEAMHIRPESGEVVTDEYLNKLQENYMDSIGYAKEAGFDGVDIKSCHGYLISELLGAYTRSSSLYGGDLIEQRGKFLLDTVKKAKKKFSDLIITLRINLFDVLAQPNGFSTKKLDEAGTPTTIDLSDLHELLDQLYMHGVRLVSFSAGNPYFNPYLSRPFVQNAFNGPDAPEHPLVSYARIIGLLREVRSRHPQLITIGTAYSWFRQFGPNFAAGEIIRNSFDIAGFGRMAFAYPQFPVDLYRDNVIDSNKVCIACSKCSELMRMGSVTGCVIRNRTYSKIYKEAYRVFQNKKKNEK